MIPYGPMMPLSKPLILHHWVIPFVLTMSLFILFHSAKELIPAAYISMFGIFYLIGNLSPFHQKSLLYNGFKVFGLSGTVVTLLIMSFKPTWKALYDSHYSFVNLITTPAFIANVIFFIVASLLVYRQEKGKTQKGLRLPEITFLVFMVIFILGSFTEIAYILVNLLILSFAVLLIREGSRRMKMGVLNSGLIVIALLAACRSFDSDIEFVIKGCMFVLVGIGFFVANWWMLKKKRENES